MTVELDCVFEIRLIEQIELAQAKHQPPAGKGDGKEHPQGDEGNDDSIAFAFHSEMSEPPAVAGG
jgi:hypothetical protein